MNNSVLFIVLSFLLPILLLCVYLEKRARRIMISFCGGVVACLVAYFLNTLLLKQFRLTTSLYTTLIAPLIEEFLKFIPILTIALLVNKGRRGSTANAYAVGIGFCLVENTYYLITNLETANIVWIIFRSIGTGLMHGMSASILGLGIFTAREKKKHTVLLIACTYIIAVLYHALFNFLVQGEVVLRILGVLLPVLTYVCIFLFVKKEDIKRFLGEAEENASETNP